MADTITVDSALINNEVHFISDPITTMEDGVFEAVLKATKLHRTLKLEYKTAKDSEYQERLFDSYHMICQKGSWYVLGYSHSSQAIRLWAMPRRGFYLLVVVPGRSILPNLLKILSVLPKKFSRDVTIAFPKNLLLFLFSFQMEVVLFLFLLHF